MPPTRRPIGGCSLVRLGCLALTWTWLIGGISSSKHEQRLIKHLTKNYNPEIRPVQHRNVTTPVAFEAEMVQLISVKERDQVHGGCLGAQCEQVKSVSRFRL